MTLCGFEIAHGEKRQVKLPVPGGAPLEAWLLCGAHPGKTLVVTAGVHGCEYVGILALQKLVETLDCATLFGQVILLPLVNSKGFFAGVKQLNVEGVGAAILADVPAFCQTAFITVRRNADQRIVEDALGIHFARIQMRVQITNI